MKTILCTLAVLLSAFLPAATSPSAETQVLILSGGKTESDARKGLSVLEARKPGLQFATGFPKLVRSDDVRGLNPGFNVALGGFCSSKGDAEMARDWANMCLKGAYLRAVPYNAPDACPKPSRQSLLPISGFERGASFPVDGKSSPFVWILLSKPSGIRNCESRSELLQVVHRQRAVAEQLLPAQCRAPRGGDDLGYQAGYEAQAAEADDGSVVVTEKQWGDDTPSVSTKVYLFGCDGISAVVPSALRSHRRRDITIADQKQSSATTIANSVKAR